MLLTLCEITSIMTFCLARSYGSVEQIRLLPGNASSRYSAQISDSNSGCFPGISIAGTLPSGLRTRYHSGLLFKWMLIMSYLQLERPKRVWGLLSSCHGINGGLRNVFDVKQQAHLKHRPKFLQLPNWTNYWTKAQLLRQVLSALTRSA